MQFCWSTLSVRDMEASLRFYTQFLGLPVQRRWSAGPSEIAFLGEGSTLIELICDRQAQPDHPTGISWGFRTASLEETLARAAAMGIPVQSGPFSPGPNIRFVFVEDPDGMRIQLVEELSADKP